MDASCLEHQLTDEERETFDVTGMLQVDDALSPQRVAELAAATDRLYERKRVTGPEPDRQLTFHGDSANPGMICDDVIHEDGAFLNLVDHERTFPKIWGLLGWNIFLYHVRVTVNPPTGARNDKTFVWHQDSGRVNTDPEFPASRLSLKVFYFLSDVSDEGHGNMWVIPGSHLGGPVEMPADDRGQPPGAVPVVAKPGTALLFDRRLWHAPSPNWSNVTRKAAFYGYSHRWLRPKCTMTTDGLMEGVDPIRRQLLGHGTSPNGYYQPTDEDVPLRSWLRDHGPDVLARAGTPSSAVHQPYGRAEAMDRVYRS